MLLMKARALPSLLRRSFSDWNDDNAPRLGASLAFYAILSLSPLTILVLAILSLVFGRSDAQSHLLDQVQALAGPVGRDAVQSMLLGGHKKSAGILATIIGVLTLLFGASGVFGELRAALNTIWEAPPGPGNGMWGLVRERIFSFAMVIGVGFVLLATLLASTALSAAAKFFSAYVPVFALSCVNFVFSFLGIALLFGLILKYVPETRVQWSDVRLGAAVTALLFTIGKSLLGLYLGEASPGSAYGAAGSLVAMVIWVYYSAQIFFFGAEFTHVYSLAKHGELGVPEKDRPESPPKAEK
jgi:membrane protein